MNIKGKLCINFEVDTNKFKRDYVNFLYNVAKKTIEIGRASCRERV